MILHCVFCQFKADITDDHKTSVLQALAEFSATLDGVIRFDFGPNRDFEDKSAEYTDGFVIKFKSQSALDLYAAHPKHKSLGVELASLCKHGADGILVFDLAI